MKYQIIRTQVGADDFHYTVHMTDEEQTHKDALVQLCRFNTPFCDIPRYSVVHDLIKSRQYCEYFWETLEEAKQFIQDHIQYLESWPTDPRNPDTWEKPKVVKEITV